MKNKFTNLKHRTELCAFVLCCLCSFLLGGAVYAQSTVSGKVTSMESGEALPGVNVIVKGTTVGTVTDIEGNYNLSVPADDAVLQFSFIGYITEEEPINGRATIDLAMAPDLQQLSEVVVVGYGTQSEKLGLQSVSEVNSEEFANQPVISPQELIQGRAAGVQVVSSSGVLGSRSNLRIRGASSMGAGNQPLYVVDGVPLNDGEYSNDLGAVSLNPLQSINPNDIESISILKDASAVAIYGSRGANGVVIINTKQGSASGRTNINLDYYTGFSGPTNNFDMMNADQYRQFRADYNLAQGSDTNTSPSDFPQGSFDWPAAVLRTGRTNNYALSASGGSESTTFYIGGTYFNQEGFTIGNEVDKLNGRFNLNHNMSDKLRFGFNLGLSALNNDRISSDNSTFAPLTSAYLQPPYVEPYNEDGTYANTGFIANVLAIEDLSIRELITRRTTGNLYAEYDIIENLTLRTDFGADLIQTEETIRDPEIVSPGGYGYKRIVQDNKWLNTTTLNFDRTLEDHYVELLLGGSFETSTRNSIAVEGSGFVSDQLPNVASAATPTLTSAEATTWALISQFARGNYRFRDRYLLEASIRRDGSSRFGTDNKFGIFWAVSGGWILSDESFMDGATFVDNLKLTASYGTSGNDRLGNFASFGLYEAGTLSDYAGIPGIRPTQPANPQLQWEETKQLDVGVSSSFFGDRLGFDFNYYIKTTEGLLLEVPLPYTTGFSNINRNVGTLENRGFDLLISGDIIRNADFQWTTSLNLGYLQNKALSLPENKDDEGRDFVLGTDAQRAIEGYSINTFYLIRYNGVNPQTGDAEWLKKNGEVTTNPTADDRVIVGSAIPDFTGGFTNTFRYKGFDLNVLFSFVSGNKVFRAGRRFTENAASSFNKSTKLLNYWEQSGDDAFFPALSSPTAGIFAQNSTLQLEDGDFIRLRNASLGYTLPSSLLSGTNFLRSARIYVMGQNLLTFAKSDLEPEINGTADENLQQGESFFTPPQARTITFGVSIGF